MIPFEAFFVKSKKIEFAFDEKGESFRRNEIKKLLFRKNVYFCI